MNWWLAAHELYGRSPTADFYAIFQDDVIFVRGLREYLENVHWPGPGYLNLYTFPSNQELRRARKGFFRSNQRGLGALALVFNNDAMRKLLLAPHMIEKFVPKPGKESRAFKAIDGGIVESFKAMGMNEWVHTPSLCQHIGQTSTLNNWNPDSACFPGEQFDARGLLK